MGYELPIRNVLTAIAARKPKIVVYSWTEPGSGFRYAVIVEVENDIGIWELSYANLRLVKDDWMMAKSYKVADMFKRQLSAFGSAALNHWLSPKGSRIVFMSTLLAYYQETDGNIDDVLKSANQQLNIVDNPKAMKSPATFGNYIWKNICDRDSKDFDHQANRILSKYTKMDALCRWTHNAKGPSQALGLH